MASREEEKRRRREEREAQRRAAEAQQKRGKRLQLVLATVLGLAIIGAGAIAIASSVGGDDGDGPSPSDEPSAEVRLPTGTASDLAGEAKRAGCTFRTDESEGQEHVSGTVQYANTPPTSGPHNPTPAQDGFYDPGNSPAKENWVHTLEHGRIIFLYKPGSPQRLIDQLETLASEPFNGADGYHTAVMEDNSGMDAAVAAVAWTRSLTCPRATDAFFPLARKFRQDYTDKAPELVP